MYHHLTERPADPRFGYLHVSPAFFKRQLRGLADYGLETLSLAEVSAAQAEARRGVVITFDDGLESVFLHGLKLLGDFHGRAIQFLVSDRVGGWNEWDAGTGAARTRLMDESQVREWLAAGHEIGAHTRTHPHLTKIPREQAREEIRGSCRQLEDRFGVAVKHFCYPYGDWSPAIRDLVAEAGYESACTVVPRVANGDSDRLALPRLLARQPRATTSLGRIRQHLKRIFS
ncbi:MAG: polysaccharide deacetylase family protein [Chthoniobacteraceae bacterium]